MPIAYTSRESYLTVQSTLSRSRLLVWEAIRDWSGPGPTIEDLAQKLPLKECSICGRINELRDLGAIEDGPLAINSTGKRAKTYRARVYICPPAAPSYDHNGQALLL